MEPTRIEVLVVTRHALLGLGLRAVCSDTPDLRCVDVVPRFDVPDDAATVCVVGPDVPEASVPATATVVRLAGAAQGGPLDVDVDLDAVVFAVRMAAGREPFHGVAATGFARLTPRELRALCLLVRGDTPTEVAHRLEVASSTVSTLIRRACDKLGVPDRHALVTLALRTGAFVAETPRPMGCPMCET